MKPNPSPKERKDDFKPSVKKRFKTVDDVVKEIERQYHKEQQQRGRVDEWGQPRKKLDKKKLREFVKKEMERHEREKKKTTLTKEERAKIAAESAAQEIAKKFKAMVYGRPESSEKKTDTKGKTGDTPTRAEEKKSLDDLDPDYRRNRRKRIQSND